MDFETQRVEMIIEWLNMNGKNHEVVTFLYHTCPAGQAGLPHFRPFSCLIAKILSCLQHYYYNP
jgi:hypothetical protein